MKIYKILQMKGNPDTGIHIEKLPVKKLMTILNCLRAF
jgi:Flp pilus assembly protein protease CpaA